LTAAPAETRPRRAELWLRAHSNLIAGLVVALGFLVRLWTASFTFLNPDEALHFLGANQPSFMGAYRASLDTAHPPLLFFVLYFWRALGTSELVLRLPSVIAGTIFCWVFFKWLTGILGRTAGWVGLILATFLPPMIELSSEVRQYALLLCFVILATYFFERALAAASAWRMSLSFLFLYLAMLAHFSAILFWGAIGGYGLLRLVSGRFSKGIIAFWTAGQAGALALFIFLYRTHISALQNSEVARGTREVVLRNSYFHPGQDHLLLFIFARSFGVCQFTFGQLAVGDVAGLALIAGIVLLLRKQAALEPSALSSRQFGIFLLLPFVVNCAAGVASWYPYGGTRHSSFLAPFVIAGVSVLIARVVKQRVVWGLGSALAIVALCQLFGSPHRPYMLRQDQSTAQMARAIASLRRQVPAGGRVFVDFQTFFEIRYYLCPNSPTPDYTYTSGLGAFDCGGYQVITPGPSGYILSPREFFRWWRDLIRTYHWQPRDRVWVFAAGWDVRLPEELKERYPEFRSLNVQSFGHNLMLFQLIVAQAVPGNPGPAGDSPISRIRTATSAE
jgi:Dolichyl-phosphate-mannose-protein mannosyltransferase